jgi:hypothetical protein
MKVSSPIIKVIIALYALLFLGQVVGALNHSEFGDLGFHLVLAGVALPPAILYFLGVKWCRHVVSAFSIIFLLAWCLIPIAQHAVDRTPQFWLSWSSVAVVLLLSSLVGYPQIQVANRAANKSLETNRR